MHEIAIANKIIEEAKRQNSGVSKLEVEVGELAEITKEELEGAFKDLVDWDVSVKFVQSNVQCACGYKGKANITDRGHGYCLFNCPSCAASGEKVKVLRGGEIKIVGVG